MTTAREAISELTSEIEVLNDQLASAREYAKHLNARLTVAVQLLHDSHHIVGISPKNSLKGAAEQQAMSLLQHIKYFVTLPDMAQISIPMVMHCPACGLQHIDAPDTDAHAHSDGRESMWTNPPHRSHLCHGCGHIWRPADVPTTGVAAVNTKGKNDSPIRSA